MMGWQPSFLRSDSTLERIFNTGEVLIQKGIKNDFVSYVNTGNLNVKKNDEIINTLSQGDVAGEMSFIAES